MGGQQQPQLPPAPNLGKSYGQGVSVYTKYLPQLQALEDQYRQSTDPKRVQEQQALQDQFGTKQYQQQLDALNQLDPTLLKNRTDLGNAVNSDLSAGYGLTPDQKRAQEQYIRSSQSARGNIDGGAPGTAEAYALGDRGVQLRQMRINNAAGFLGLPTVGQDVGMVAPVSPDRSSAYVNPNAGYLGAQYALQNYQNQAAAAASQPVNKGPWGMIGGIAGTAIGAYFGGPMGAQAGGALGSGIGNYFSDPKLKTNIEKVGKTKFGLNKYRFNYKTPKFEGVMADEVAKKVPGAVSTDPMTGFKKVDYNKLGLKMRRVA